MKTVHVIAFVLVIIGGLNWLLVGLFTGWDLAVYLGVVIAKIIYILVGLSAVFELFTHKSSCKMCSTDGAMSKPQM
jgi:uncharacterized membrane protein YuzA (DUF378 family)